MRWTQMARWTYAPDAYGEVVWFGRRGAGVKLAIRSAGDGGKRAVLRGEHEVSRKAIAQGRPECFPLPCMLVCKFCLAQIARETAGAASTRSSLRPLNKRAGSCLANLGRRAPRECASSFSRHCGPPGRANARPMTGSAKQSIARQA